MSDYDPFLDSYEWRTVRMRVLERDGAKCACCGATAADGAVMNVDHIKNRRQYPELALTMSNLQVLCAACNHGKGNKYSTDWRCSSPPTAVSPSRRYIRNPPSLMRSLIHAALVDPSVVDRLGLTAVEVDESEDGKAFAFIRNACLSAPREDISRIASSSPYRDLFIQCLESAETLSAGELNVMVVTVLERLNIPASGRNPLTEPLAPLSPEERATLRTGLSRG